MNQKGHESTLLIDVNSDLMTQLTSGQAQIPNLLFPSSEV